MTDTECSEYKCKYYRDKCIHYEWPKVSYDTFDLIPGHCRKKSEDKCPTIVIRNKNEDIKTECK